MARRIGGSMEDYKNVFDDDTVIVEDEEASFSDSAYDAKSEQEVREIAMFNSYFAQGYDDYE